MVKHLVSFMLLLAGASAHAELVDVSKAKEFDKHAATVLLFISTDCPIANGMAPEMNKIVEAFSKQDVVFYRVYADEHLDEAAIEKHGEDYALKFPAILDKDLALVEMTGATVTPEAAVYDREGKRVYRGRINNRYEDLGKYRQRSTQNDLHDALQALLSGKPVAEAETKAVGCFLPQPKKPSP